MTGCIGAFVGGPDDSNKVAVVLGARPSAEGAGSVELSSTRSPASRAG